MLFWTLCVLSIVCSLAALTVNDQQVVLFSQHHLWPFTDSSVDPVQSNLMTIIVIHTHTLWPVPKCCMSKKIIMMDDACMNLHKQLKIYICSMTHWITPVHEINRSCVDAKEERKRVVPQRFPKTKFPSKLWGQTWNNFINSPKNTHVPKFALARNSCARFP